MGYHRRGYEFSGAYKTRLGEGKVVTMYTHLIVYTRIKGVALAYHLATSNEDGQKFDCAVERLNQNTEVIGSD